MDVGKIIISHIHSSNKTISYDVKVLKAEIDGLKSNIIDIELKLKSRENDDIYEYNKFLLNLEKRVSVLFSNYAGTSTKISINREDVGRLNNIISHIAG